MLRGLETCEVDRSQTSIVHVVFSHPDTVPILDMSSQQTYPQSSISTVSYRSLDGVHQGELNRILTTSCGSSNILIYASLFDAYVYGPKWFGSMYSYNKRIVNDLDAYFATLQGRSYDHVTVMLVSYHAELHLRKVPLFYKTVTIYFWGTPACQVVNKTIDTGDFLCRVVGVSDETLKARTIEETWWFRWYFNVPLCLRGRLTQSTGTCWMNAVLNMIFLTLRVKDMIVALAHDTQVIPFSQFDDVTISLRSLILSTANHLLIQRTKATSRDANFVGHIASRVKGKVREKDELYYIRSGIGVSYGDSYDPGTGIQIVLREIFESTGIRYLNIDMMPTMSFASVTIPSGYDIVTIRNVWWMKTGLVVPELVSVPTEKSGMALAGAALAMTTDGGMHAICGLRCGDRYFVYDSNNIVSEDEWWRGDISKYRNESKQLYTAISTVFFSFLLYVK